MPRSLSPASRLLLLLGLGGGLAVAGGCGSSDPGPEGYPCDVLDVLRAKCFTCHTSPPVMGAPVSLRDFAILRKGVSDGANQLVWERMKLFVGVTMEMPPAFSPTGPISEQQRATLMNWLNAGAPGSTARCPEPVGDAAAAEGG